MTPLLSLILLVLIAYVGATFFHKTTHTSILLKSVSHSGIFYLLLGYIIGPNLLKILATNILEDLSLLLAFVLGWTGFLIGLQISTKQMKRFPIYYYWKAIGNFSITFALISGGIMFLNSVLNYYLNLSEILILAVAGTVSSPILIGVLKKDFKIRGKLIHFLQFHSAYDNMLGVITVGLIMTGMKQTLGSSHYHVALTISLSILIVTILAALFYFVVKDIRSVPQYFLIIVGFVLFLVGMALHLGQSSLFMAFIFGVVLANLPLNTWKLFQTIANAEKPIYLILLVFMGASLAKLNYLVVIATILFSIWRILNKYVVGRIVFKNIDKNKEFPGIIGLTGIGMGGLSLALGIDYHLSSASGGGEFILSIIALSYLVNDTISLNVLKPVIKTNGEKKSV